MKAIAAVLALTGAARAGAFEVGEQNAVSAATGGAGAARDDDPGAAWHDPAALADGGGIRVGVTLVAARPELQAHGDGWANDSAASWSTPPHLDASIARGTWAAGLAVGVPFGGDVAWPKMWAGADSALATELTDFRIAPFVARRFGPLRVAVGVHVDAARLQLERALDFIDTQGDVKLDMAGHGVGADAAAYYAARTGLGDVGIGLVYRSRTQIAFWGPANFTTPDAFSAETPDQQAHTTMTLPDELVLGARWRRGEITALADLAYTVWHTNQSTVIGFAEPQTPQAVQANDWHDTLAVRAGGEWRRDRLVVRAGGYYDPSPVPAQHLVPVTPDATRVGLTAGASWTVAPGWAADAFGEWMWLLSRETTSVDTMPASYGGSAVVVGAGVRWTR